MWYEWFFDGIGTSIFSSIFSVVCGIVFYRIFIKKRIKQSQVAKNFAEQYQEGEIDDNIRLSKDERFYNSLEQRQRAGSVSTQVQVGKINHGN